MADLVFCSHYLFTRQAKEYAAQRGIELTSGIVEKAEQRVRDAISEGGKLKRVA